MVRAAAAKTKTSVTNSDLGAICREWDPKSLVTFYNWTMAPLGIRFPPHLYPVVLGLCDTRIRKLMFQCCPGSGKSQLLSIIYPAWLLGHDPTQSIIGISGAEDLAQGFIAAVMDLIKDSAPYHEAFPGVLPDKEKGWSPAGGIWVKGARPGTPDASYSGYGLASKALTGKHGRTLILDDLHDAQNSASDEQCDEVVRKFSTQIMGRADPVGARFLLAGRRWSVRDLYGRLETNEDWVVLRLPAEREGSSSLYHDVYVPEDPETGEVVKCVFTDGHALLGDGQLVKVVDVVPPHAPLEKD